MPTISLHGQRNAAVSPLGVLQRQPHPSTAGTLCGKNSMRTMASRAYTVAGQRHRTAAHARGSGAQRSHASGFRMTTWSGPSDRRATSFGPDTGRVPHRRLHLQPENRRTIRQLSNYIEPQAPGFTRPMIATMPGTSPSSKKAATYPQPHLRRILWSNVFPPSRGRRGLATLNYKRLSTFWLRSIMLL